MKHIFLLSAISLLFACNPTRDNKADTSGYDVITEKVYVYREVKPATGNPLTDSILQLKMAMTQYLQGQGFRAHIAGKDSLLFRRSNGQEVIIELPRPQDAWEANTIIVFDPVKNPLFVNLRRGTSQVQQYISANNK